MCYFQFVYVASAPTISFEFCRLYNIAKLWLSHSFMNMRPKTTCHLSPSRLFGRGENVIPLIWSQKVCTMYTLNIEKNEYRRTKQRRRRRWRYLVNAQVEAKSRGDDRHFVAEVKIRNSVKLRQIVADGVPLL